MTIFSRLLLLILILPILLSAGDEETNLETIMQNTDLSVQWFLNYGYDDSKDMGTFSLKRGYFTIKTKLNETFSVRYTQDITLDKEGGDAGNVEIRLKYMYMKMKMDQFDFLPISYFELGLVHRPWLDFEQKINQYRAQGRMYAERAHLINSADFGITYTGLFGEKINKQYQKEVNKSNPGKYGSFSIGVYNGAGYHAIEKNNNKTLEGRLTLRPLPEIMPGLQFSYAGVYGKANTSKLDTLSDFQINLLFVSSESKYHVATFQYYMGKGDQEGELRDAVTKESFENDGYSAFGEFKIPGSNFAVFGRYDEFNSDQGNTVTESTTIAGLTYRFLKNKVFVDVNQFHVHSNTTNVYEHQL